MQNESPGDRGFVSLMA